jgi:formylglycine-generating enzyme required for sulfatase activity
MGSGGTEAAAGSSANGGETAAGGSGQGGTPPNLSEPPSCRGGSKPPICGPNVDSCCLSLSIPGQTFYRSYDGVSPDAMSQASPASVSSFQLDRFEVTVGRFRKFVDAAVASWRPAAGSGKHAHLNDQQGLANVASAGGFESGWNEDWNDELPGDLDEWNAALSCDPIKSTWTDTPSGNDLAPINCLSWYEAYAFCVWDEGFLPSEAEWNDVATGGEQQRAYPWSLVPTSLTIDCLHANYAPLGEFCTAPPTGTVTPVGAKSPKGDSRWGHADLGGNVYEWVLDSYSDTYVTPCINCTYLDGGSMHSIRGGSFSNDAPDLLASTRNGNQALGRSTSLGARCARLPQVE